MKIGIVGNGHVGGAMHKLFENAVIYDEPQNIGNRDEINSCEVYMKGIDHRYYYEGYTTYKTEELWKQ